MADYEAYTPETAADLFRELLYAHSLLPDYAAAYKAMGKTLQKCLSEQTSFTDVRLVGTFAKLDYLLKEKEAPKDLRRQANNTRVRLNKISRKMLPISEAKRFWTYDLQSLSLLFAHLYNNSSIPVELESLFPHRRVREQQEEPTLGKDYIRLMVDRWDDTYIYGRNEEDGTHEVKVCYAKGNHNYNYDWSYLRPLLQAGTQLNLIQPRTNEGVIYPELIIFEPDYLVDISNIAHSFAVYAESPMVDLVCKLSPAPQSKEILLGGMASQLLDEELHDEHRSYTDSAIDFFRSKAFDLLTCNTGNDFHQDAMKQRANIHNAISIQLPLLSEKYDKRNVLVEPSFFSEMLGLQGRMDFLQLDYRVLIEQKSGKGEWGSTDENPRQKEEHYVQMLLYMAILRYNYREQYEKNQRQLHAFLLYSKYENSLLGLGFAPELLFRAIRLRNQLTWHHLQYASQGFDILRTLTPDQLNEKHINGTLWECYKKPELAALLSPIHQATQLERSYYLRMLRFVAAEHTYSKLGNKTKENSGFASLWLDSLDEKLAAGNIYDQLRLCPPQEGKVSELTFTFASQTENDMSNFRTGDIVIVYPYDKDGQPDARRTIVFRGSIADITVTGITLRLRSAQTDAWVFLRDKEKPWAVEHDFMESGDNALFRGMQTFLSAPKERRDLIMLQREPQVNDTLRLKGNYGAFNELSLRTKQAQDLFLIIGPPGTGKTSYGMLNTLQEELLEEGSNVLIMSYTNRAVDEICSKLHGAIPFIRIGGPLSCSPEYREHLLSNVMTQCANIKQLSQVISQTRVFVGTTSALGGNQQLFQLKQFSLAIVDEASQILEPHLMPLLAAQHKGRPAISKFVMIGDHKQLPAVVQQRPSESRVTEKALLEIGLTDCRLSLFERLLRRYGHDPRFTYMLTKQGRMHPDIARFPNEAFYQGRLQVVPLPHQLASSDDPRVRFIDVPAPPITPSDKVNQPEADIIAREVMRIYEREKEVFLPDETIGIIVPYRNQIATVRSTIDRMGISCLHDITIDTVERYQGSQRRYIIYGFTIQQHYQLRFLTDSTFMEGNDIIDRKLNVAMTRAQEYLILVGNATLLSTNSVYARLLQSVPVEQANTDK